MHVKRIIYPGSIRGANLSVLFLRLTAGLALVINHGWPTFWSVLQGNFAYPDPLGIGVVATMVLMASAEFLGAALVVIGLATRPALLALTVGFAVAFFVHHSADPWGHREGAYLYLIVFTGLLISGPGEYSLDHLLFRKTQRLSD